ncbi:hypothetical protein, partial [Brevibacillus agri]|uniref:hypothetical protein n=3 Tax=Brevibacillus TaxID=55080 RepID=UPI003D1A67F1
FKAGKSFNDRLINAFAVQFSKSIFATTTSSYQVVQVVSTTFLSCLTATSLIYHIPHQKSKHYFV